jgi:D-alanyl-lipoteichoic acid acyltransferase DltB (MBOAT superfamily)
VLIADHVAHYATPVFSAAAAARPLSFLEGWVGALAYTLQLYFDFSGYSEMAIGAALLFGIRLPLNFASPYKAGSIIEFWRRWHMTLSRFLRDYLYIPLGGNRRGPGRRYVNLMITMALGGLWHGAGWTFVLWGVLHGAYLTVNHAWNAWAVARPLRLLGTWVGGPLTFLAVVFGWVLFRAESFGAAERMIQAMVQPAMPGGPAPLVDLRAAALVIAPLLAWVFLGPNTQQLARYDPSPQAQSPRPEGRSGRWRLARAAGLGLVFAAAFLSLSKVTEFLYFQF